MVLYEIFMDSFVNKNGFKDLTEKVDYLKELGIEMVWLTPFYESNSYHGYDVKNYKSINPRYGNFNDFNEFINKCHENNIKVIIDLVLAHTSYYYHWFQESIKGHNDFYYWSDVQPENKCSTPVSENGWRYCYENNKFYLAPWSHEMPSINVNHPKVRDEIESIVRFWLDKKVDGFRLDAAPYVDIMTNKPLDFWRWFEHLVHSIKPDAYMVAEAWDSYGVSKQYTDVLGHSFNFEMAGYIKGKATNPHQHIPMNGTENDVYFLSNHDMTRSMSSMNGDVNKMKYAFDLLFDMPGDIILYYGEEIGMKGVTHQHTCDNDVRRPMDWNEVFRQRNDPNSLFNYVKQKIKTYKNNRA